MFKFILIAMSLIPLFANGEDIIWGSSDSSTPKFLQLDTEFSCLPGQTLIIEGAVQLSHKLENVQRDQASTVIISCDNVYFGPNSKIETYSSLRFKVSGTLWGDVNVVSIRGKNSKAGSSGGHGLATNPPAKALNGRPGDRPGPNCTGGAGNPGKTGFQGESGKAGFNGENGLNGASISIFATSLGEFSTLNLVTYGGNGGAGGLGGNGAKGSQGGEGGNGGTPGYRRGHDGEVFPCPAGTGGKGGQGGAGGSAGPGGQGGNGGDGGDLTLTISKPVRHLLSSNFVSTAGKEGTGGAPGIPGPGGAGGKGGLDGTSRTAAPSGAGGSQGNPGRAGARGTRGQSGVVKVLMETL